MIVCLQNIPEDGDTSEVRFVDTTKLPENFRSLVEQSVGPEVGDIVTGTQEAWSLWDAAAVAQVPLPAAVEAFVRLWSS